METLLNAIYSGNLVAALQIAGIGMGVVLTMMATISTGIWASGRIAVTVENRMANRTDARTHAAPPSHARPAHRAAA